MKWFKKLSHWKDEKTISCNWVIKITNSYQDFKQSCNNDHGQLHVVANDKIYYID
jgi:hypothetical protein